MSTRKHLLFGGKQASEKFFRCFSFASGLKNRKDEKLEGKGGIFGGNNYSTASELLWQDY